MKNLLLLSFLFFFCFAQIQAQDTLRVQTFTWNMNQRADTFDFPDNPGEQYRKILMKYNMRCHGAAVGNGSVGCREWDYSCNTFITDPTGTDSTQQIAPNYEIGGFAGDTFYYENSATSNYFQINQSVNEFDPNGLQDWSFPTTNTDTFVVDSKVRTYKHQSLIKAADLAIGGTVSGFLKGLILESDAPNSSYDFFRIKIQNTTQDVLTKDAPVMNGWSQVYVGKAVFGADNAAYIPFTNAYNYTGGNLLIEFSFTRPLTGDAPNFLGEKPINNRIQTIHTSTQNDRVLQLDGRGSFDIDPTAVQLSNEVTVMFWSFGLPDKMPSNSTPLEAVDGTNLRQINIHLPWSNGQVYWDCGNDGSGYDRINKQSSEAEFEGRWSHWAFTKNATTGEMKIYLDGQLWHSGTGKTKHMDIAQFHVGANVSGGNPFKGHLDDLSVWDKELSEAEIQMTITQSPNMDHPQYASLLVHYPFDEASGTIVHNATTNGNGDAEVFLPAWRSLRGFELQKNFEEANFVPQMIFVQGAAPSTSIPMTVLDPFPAQGMEVVEFTLQGTDRVEVGREILFPAGNRPVFDLTLHEVGNSLSSTQDALYISQLTYFQKQESKYEILSLVTPYGNGLDLGDEGKTFIFDVTDYAPILKGQRRMSLEYGGQNQEEMDIEFMFIKGTPEREVLNVQNIWPQRRGTFDQIQADRFFEPRMVALPHAGAHFKIRSAITGHGQNGEFVSRQHFININGGTQEFQFDVWKECGKNPIYPQGGTWIFDRAGWCPGMETDVHEFDITPLLMPGDIIEIDYGVNGATMASANYLVNNQLVTYGPYTAQNDASIESIVRPNNQQVEFERLNPSCNTPTIRVKNAGANAITSIELEYGTASWTTETFTWTGSLSPQEMVDIVLPSPKPEFWLASSIFSAKILSVNGGVDDNNENDMAHSTFDVARNYTYTEPMRMRFLTNNIAGDNTYKLTDGSGAVIFERTSTFSNTEYIESLDLPPGCYTLEVEDNSDDGLEFWFFPNNGVGNLVFQREIQPNVNIPVQGFDPDFGGGVQFDFVMGGLVDENTPDKVRLFSTYPNPTTDVLFAELQGYEGMTLSFRIMDMTGKVLKSMVIDVQNERSIQEFDISDFPKGMYLLQCTDGVRNWTRTVTKS